MPSAATEFRVMMRSSKPPIAPDTPEERLQDLVETAKARIRPEF